MEKLTEQEKIRRQKMEELKEMGIEPFGQAYERTHKSGQIRAEYEGCTKEELEEKNVTVKVAGRIMTKRRQGKAGFMHIQDIDGQSSHDHQNAKRRKINYHDMPSLRAFP